MKSLVGTIRPPTFVLVTFLAAIAVGALLLKLPFAVERGMHLGWVDALFTATSAVCVTGLAVTDTGTTFSGFGELVILVLIQLGGLGITTMGTLFLVLLGERLSLRSERVVEETLGRLGASGVRGLILYAVAFTLAMELTGAALLTLRLAWRHGVEPDAALYQGLFHSVSAYCNAGFSLYPDNLTRMRHDPFFLFVVMALIVIGGLGFLVTFNVSTIRWWEKDALRRGRLTLHSRVALAVSGFLIVLGALVILPLEWDQQLAGLNVFDKAVNALFHSVAPRTAGFNTINLAEARSGTLFFTCFLMFVGGSPGSAAGGIKTTTFFVLVLVVRALFTGRPQVTTQGRTLPAAVIHNAIALFFVALAWTFLVSFLLLWTERRIELGAQHGLLAEVLFEVLSAFGTVGLSTGITPYLSALGKLVLIGTMYVGRVGPLTLVLAMSRIEPRNVVQYPEGRISIG